MRHSVTALVFFWFAALCLAVPAVAQQEGSPQRQRGQGLAPAEDVFEGFIEAMGGREAVFGVENRRIRGTYEGMPFDFKVQLRIWWESDGRYHQRVSEPAGRSFDVFVNGEYTWLVPDGGEPRPVLGMQRQDLLDTADFYGEANYEERYKEYRTVAKANADGTPVWVVEAVTQIGRPITLFFDRESGLLVGTRVPVMGENQKTRQLIVRLSDYEEFEGVTYPTRVRQTFADTESTSEYRYLSVEQNVDDDHDYSVPDSIVEFFDKIKKNAQERSGEPAGADADG